MIAAKILTVAGLGTFVALAGCSNKEEMDSLRSEIAGVRATAEAADAKASAAQAEAAAASAAAEQAAAEAQAASDKAEVIFRENLRK